MVLERAVLTEAVTDDGDFGTFFLHNEGYSTMCGHAMIALVTLVLDTGIIKGEGESPVVKIDAPPGRLLAKVEMENGKIVKCSFKNVPSFTLIQQESINVPGIGIVKFDVAYGGAFYVFCNATKLGLKLDASK